MMSEDTGRVPRSRVIRKKQADNTYDPSEEKSQEKARDAIIERKSKLQSTADRLAGSTFHYRNWYFHEGKEEFPQHNDMRCVDKMYPFAEGGQLLVDEPRTQFEIDQCNDKKKVLHRLGYRYVIITPGMSLLEAAEGLRDVVDNG